MGEGVGGGPVKHGTAHLEARAVARAVEGLGRRIEGYGAAKVRAVLRENLHLALLVFGDETSERELPSGIVASAVGHDERGVWAGGGVELDRIPILDLIHRGGEEHLQRDLLLTLGRRGPH